MVTGGIGTGFLVLLGISAKDTEREAIKLADKFCGLRTFEDLEGKMNLNLAPVEGSISVVSQFTPNAD